MPQTTTSGVVGTPTKSTPERGAELFEAVVEALVRLLEQARAERDPL